MEKSKKEMDVENEEMIRMGKREGVHIHNKSSHVGRAR